MDYGEDMLDDFEAITDKEPGTFDQTEKKRDISGGVAFDIPVELMLLLGDYKKKRDLSTDTGVDIQLGVALALALGYDVNADDSISNPKKRNVIGNLLETVDNSAHDLADTISDAEDEFEADEYGYEGSDSEAEDENTANESKRALDTQVNVEHSDNGLDVLVVAGTGPSSLVIRPSSEEDKRDLGNINVENLSGNLNAPQDGVKGPIDTKVMTKRGKRAPLGDITISNLAGNIDAAQDGVSAPTDTKILSEEKKRDVDANVRGAGNLFDDAEGVANNAIDKVGDFFGVRKRFIGGLLGGAGVDGLAGDHTKRAKIEEDIDISLGGGGRGGNRFLGSGLSGGGGADGLAGNRGKQLETEDEIDLNLDDPQAKAGQSDAHSNSDVSTKKEKRLSGDLMDGSGNGDDRNNFELLASTLR